MIADPVASLSGDFCKHASMCFDLTANQKAPSKFPAVKLIGLFISVCDLRSSWNLIKGVSYFKHNTGPTSSGFALISLCVRPALSC